MLTEIDRAGIKQQYFSSDIVSISTFLREEMGRSKAKAGNGNTVKRTTGRGLDKQKYLNSITAESSEILRRREIEDRVNFNRQIKNYYTANTKAILNMVKEAQEGKKKLTLKDRIEINREMRTIMGIPNNITSASYRDLDDVVNTEDPATALFNIIDGDDQIQDTDDRTDQQIDDS